MWFIKRNPKLNLVENAEIIAKLMLSIEQNFNVGINVEEINSKGVKITDSSDQFCTYNTMFAKYDCLFSIGYICLIGERDRKFVKHIYDYLKQTTALDLETVLWDSNFDLYEKKYVTGQYTRLTYTTKQTRVIIYSERGKRKPVYEDMNDKRFVWIIDYGDQVYLRGKGEHPPHILNKSMCTIIYDSDDTLNFPTHTKCLEYPKISQLSSKFNFVTRRDIYISVDIGLGFEMQKMENGKYEVTTVDTHCPFTFLSKYVEFSTLDDEYKQQAFKKNTNFKTIWNIFDNNAKIKTKKNVDDIYTTNHCVNCWGYLHGYVWLFQPVNKKILFPVCSACIYDKDSCTDVKNVVYTKISQNQPLCKCYIINFHRTISDIINEDILPNLSKTIREETGLEDSEYKEKEENMMTYWKLIKTLDEIIRDPRITNKVKFRSESLRIDDPTDGSKYYGIGTSSSLREINESIAFGMFMYTIYPAIPVPSEYKHLINSSNDNIEGDESDE